MSEGFRIFDNAKYGKINPLKRVLLWFLPERIAIDGDFVCRFKVFGGAFYVLYCGRKP